MKLFGQHDGNDWNQQAQMNLKSFSQRRQSAPSLILSKALTKTKSSSSSSECVSLISPDSCLLVQSLLGPRRSLVCHGGVRLQTGLQTQERYLFLFTDIFIISKAKSSSQVKQKACVCVCEMWTASCMDEVCEGTTSPDRSFVIGWPTYNCVVTFSSAYQKERWLSLLESCIQEQKEHDEPKVIPLKIYTKDAGNCAYTKTLFVRNSDSTSDIINKALQQFGLPGNVIDFQLWVSSIKDEAPYPLIGHEFPYSIKMSHIRALQKDEQMPPHNQMTLMSDDTNCQFILRPRRVNGTCTFKEEQKKRIPLLTWPFRRNSTTELERKLQTTLSVGHAPDSAPGSLFGRPLSDVMVDHTLPPSIKDMLVCLCNEGALTCGIFRRSAGVKACQELKEKLDSGLQNTSLNEEPILVTAAVFKEFLRNIPGSLLCEDLYDQWLKAIEQNADDEREKKESSLQAVQRLVQLLPNENRLLLRHVVAMLHCVQSCADHNQMNSSNLAVCIAPSLLWSNRSLSQREDTKKVCDLVCFLIDHCRSVFGDDITSLTDFHLDNSSSPRSAGSLQRMSDSCYESLENELNAEPEDRPRTGPLKDTQSRDSLISLSDGDLDQSDPDVELESSLPLARIRKFTPAVRQPRPYKLRRSSEPTLAHVHSSAEMISEGRKASLDSSTPEVEEENEDDKDDVFLKKSFQHLKLTCRGGGASLPRRRNQAKLQLNSSGSRLSSMATSLSSMSSMDSSLDSVFSQNGALSSPQDSPFEDHQCGELLQKSHKTLHPVSWMKEDQHLSQETDSTSARRSLCVKHLSCRASNPPSYQEALTSLNRTPPTSALLNVPKSNQTNTSNTPTPSFPLLHEAKSLFYRGPESPAIYPTEKHQVLSDLQTMSSTCSKNQKTSRNGSVDSQEESQVMLPKSVFFGQTCKLKMQMSKLSCHTTAPALQKTQSIRENYQNKIPAFRSQWAKKQGHRVYSEESYV